MCGILIGPPKLTAPVMCRVGGAFRVLASDGERPCVQIRIVDGERNISVVQRSRTAPVISECGPIGRNGEVAEFLVVPLTRIHPRHQPRLLPAKDSDGRSRSRSRSIGGARLPSRWLVSFGIRPARSRAADSAEHSSRSSCCRPASGRSPCSFGSRRPGRRDAAVAVGGGGRRSTDRVGLDLIEGLEFQLEIARLDGGCDCDVLLDRLEAQHVDFNVPASVGNLRKGILPWSFVIATRSSSRSRMTRAYIPFAEIADGSWNIEVDMLCFETIKQDVAIAATVQPGDFELKLPDIRSDQGQLGQCSAAPSSHCYHQRHADRAVRLPKLPRRSTRSRPTTRRTRRMLRRIRSPLTGRADPKDTSQRDGKRARRYCGCDSGCGIGIFRRQERRLMPLMDSWLTVRPTISATSPFALSAAFGNNRRGPRSLYNGNISLTIDDSNLDARPFSITGQTRNAPPTRTSPAR